MNNLNSKKIFNVVHEKPGLLDVIIFETDNEQRAELQIKQKLLEKKWTEIEDPFTGSFHLAAFQGDIDKIKESLEKNSRLVETRHSGLFSLHQAISGGHFSCVQLLVDSGHDLNAKSQNNITPIHIACLEGKLEILKYLHNQGADIKCLGVDDFSGVHMAAARGHEHVVHYLLNCGLSLYSQNKRCMTPLLLAERAGRQCGYLVQRMTRHVSLVKSELKRIFFHLKVPYELVLQIIKHLVTSEQLDIINRASIEAHGIPRREALMVLQTPISAIWETLKCRSFM